MQLIKFDRGETDRSSSQGVPDCQGFNVQHIFFAKPSDCTEVLQLSNNGIDLQKQIDSFQTSGSCYCCLHGHSSITRCGIENCSTAASSFNGHNSTECKGNNGRLLEGVCQEMVVARTTGSEDRCTCNNFTGICCSNSLSSVGSLMMPDDEAADHLQTPEEIQEVDHDKESQLSESYASRVEDLQLDLLECALEYEVKSVPIKGNHQQLLQVEQFEAVLGRILENAPRELLKKPSQVGTWKVPSNIQSPRMKHSTPVDCIREVYELQKELQRLAVYR